MLTMPRLSNRSIPALLAWIVCLAATAPSVGAQAPTEAPKPPGKLYMVHGHAMHLNCGGSGSPTVVLEAGAGAFSIDWYFVQPAVAQMARVCSYDRAGHAWSELGPVPRTGLQAMYDLHELLRVAGEHGPFLLAAHSLGGTLARLFAMQYPADVAGMVLLDVGTETSLMFIDGRWTRWFSSSRARLIPAPRGSMADTERVLSDAERKGAAEFWKLNGPPAIEAPYDKLPAPVQATRLWAMSQPSSVTSDFDPYLAEELTLLLARRITEPHPLGAMPLIVIGKTPEAVPENANPASGPALRITERPEQLRGLGELSTNSIVMTATSSRHEIHLDQPQVVVEAIHAVLEAARHHLPLKPLTSGVTVIRQAGDKNEQ